MKMLSGFTYLLIVWGGVVRRSGSGLGCPDWPLCHGQWIPPMETATLIEYTHRLLAAIVSLLTIAVAIGIWRSPLWRARCGWRAAGLLFLLAAQAGLGGMVVMTELQPWLVAAHLALAFLFFGLTISTTLNEKHYSGLAWCALIAVYCQAVIGGTVSGYQAGLTCPDFPTCQGSWWPPFVGLVAIHMTHRIGAVLTTVLVGGFVATRWKRASVGTGRCWLVLTLFFLALQIALGIGNVLFGLPFVVDIAHLAIAAALFGTIILSGQCILPTSSHSPNHASSSSFS